MENFNKIVSFILGLVVVVVFLAVISGKINLKKVAPGLANKNTPTPTMEEVTPTPKAISSVSVSNKNYQPYQTRPATSIPNTGSPTAILLTSLLGLPGGLFLKRVKKNN
ncbi:MAG: hypothetical protein N2482_00820 [Patescibacteria group bacterium]|nr:hypothetical protein [Patescibacteria group bacterium]